MKNILLFFAVFVSINVAFAGGESGKKYVFNQYKVQSELGSEKATFDSVSKLLDGITNDEQESKKMYQWFKPWLLKQEKLNWNATRAIMEYGGFTVIDNDVFHKYFDISCFDGSGDTGWDKLIDYVTPYFNDNFHFSLSIKLAKQNDRNKTICVLSKLAKYINYADLDLYKENAIVYKATNVTDVFNELDNEVKKMNN